MNSMIPYARWSTQPQAVRGRPREKPFKGVVIHHTATGLDATPQVLERGHVVDNGWTSLGYNFLVNSAGMIFEGRGFDVIGAHCKGWNSEFLGIAYIGDGRKAGMPEAALAAVVAVILEGVVHGALSEDELLVWPHSAWVATVCPGPKIQEQIQLVAAAVMKARQAPVDATVQQDLQAIRDAVDALGAQVDSLLGRL
jgi:hypothetical protein